MHLLLNYKPKAEGLGVEIDINNNKIIFETDNVENVINAIYSFCEFLANDIQELVRKKELEKMKGSIMDFSRKKITGRSSFNIKLLF